MQQGRFYRQNWDMKVQQRKSQMIKNDDKFIVVEENGDCKNRWYC